MSLQDVYNMSWAEFILRSIGFKEQREFDMRMTRQVAYEVHTIKYMFGKKNPPKIESYWNIGEAIKKVSKSTMEHLKELQREYQKKKRQKP